MHNGPRLLVHYVCAVYAKFTIVLQKFLVDWDSSLI